MLGQEAQVLDHLQHLQEVSIMVQMKVEDVAFTLLVTVLSIPTLT